MRLDNPQTPFQLRIQVSAYLVAHIPHPPKSQWKNATDHTGGAEKALYCWGWRVTSIVCPDCREEYLRVSFDWAQLSLLGDGGITDHLRGRRYRDSATSTGTNLEGDPGVRHGHPRDLTGSCVHWTQLQEWFHTSPASSEARGGAGTCGLGSPSGAWH